MCVSLCVLVNWRFRSPQPPDHIFKRFAPLPANRGHLADELVAYCLFQRQPFVRVAKQLDQLLFDDGSNHFPEFVLSSFARQWWHSSCLSLATWPFLGFYHRGDWWATRPFKPARCQIASYSCCKRSPFRRRKSDRRRNKPHNRQYRNPSDPCDAFWPSWFGSPPCSRHWRRTAHRRPPAVSRGERKMPWRNGFSAMRPTDDWTTSRHWGPRWWPAGFKMMILCVITSKKPPR